MIGFLHHDHDWLVAFWIEVHCKISTTVPFRYTFQTGNDIVVGRAAKDFANVTYTYEAVADGAGAGADATFRVHKCQRYAAWKVDTPRSPCGTA